MDFVLTWDGAGPEDLLIVVSGPTTPDALQDMAAATVSSPHFRDEMHVLIDYRRARFADMSSADVRRQAAHLAKNGRKIGSHRAALVMGSQVDYGIMRQLEAMVDDRVPYVIQAFLDISEARAWLTADAARRS